MRGAVLAVVLMSASAFSASRTLDNTGRITVMAGYRYTPNGYFIDKAKAAASDYSLVGPGGLYGGASFGYGAFEWCELLIDAFVAWEQFKLQGHQEPFTSFSYGALLGVRITRNDFPIEGVVPHLGLQVGPVLSIVSSSTEPGTEKVQNGYMFSAGFTWRFADRFGLTFDVRYLMARHFVADIAGMSVGGLMFSLGFTTYFIPPPKTENELQLF